MAMTGSSTGQGIGDSCLGSEERSSAHPSGQGQLGGMRRMNNLVLSKGQFGRNTLYNPTPKSDLLEIFPVGDAMATSQAAANLIRPTHKPESR